MIGYLNNNNDFYTGNVVEHRIKTAVARSGGNKLHYELFKTLVESSIYNESLKVPNHDCRAAYSLLLLYPIRVRLLLTLILYREELNCLSQFPEYKLINNIVKPINNLLLINAIDKVDVSKKVLGLIKDLNLNFELNSFYLKEILNELNIKTEFDFRQLSFKEKINQTLNLLNNNYTYNNEFINIANSNNRMKAAVLICKKLNYKPVSINIISQGVEQWLLQNSNI